MRKVLLKISYLIIVLAVLSVSGSPLRFSEALSQDKDKQSIAIILSRNSSPYRSAIAGFRQRLAELGVDADIVVHDIEGKYEEGHLAALIIKKSAPDLIVPVGSIATEVALNEFYKDPVLFMMVLCPEESGVVIKGKSVRSNITGVCLDVPPKAQFETLKRCVPWVKRVGVLYNPSHTRSVVDQAKAAAAELNIELIAVPVYSAAKVPDSLRSISGKVDALWAVADSTVFYSRSVRQVIAFTLRNRMPFMGLSSYFVKEGALLALSQDYIDIGAQSGDMAFRILRGDKPSSIPVEPPRRAVMSLNLRSAARIGLKPDADIVSQADEVIR